MKREGKEEDEEEKEGKSVSWEREIESEKEKEKQRRTRRGMGTMSKMMQGLVLGLYFTLTHTLSSIDNMSATSILSSPGA